MFVMTISTFPLLIWTLIIWSTIKVVTSAIELDFSVTPEVIHPLETNNVTLQCLVNLRAPYYNSQPDNYFYNEVGELYQQRQSPSKASSSGLAMIRIMKRLQLQSQWLAIAQIASTAHNVVQKLDENVISSEGVISDDLKTQSFLQISWDLTTLDAFGTYRCDAISFDNQQNVLLTSSRELSLSSSLNAFAFLRQLKQDMTNVEETINQLRQGQSPDHDQTQKLTSKLQTLENKTERQYKELDEEISQLGDLLNAEMNNLGKRFDDLKSEKTNKSVGSNIEIGKDIISLILWPRGSYGLLQPESGCPVGGATSWESGWVRYHTESTNENKDELSPVTHLKQPNKEKEGKNSHLTLHFCIKTSAHLIGLIWPKGSFCINKKGDCPDKFKAGYVFWDEEDAGHHRKHGGSLPDGDVNSKNTNMSYCCRNDGPADIPIFLPNSDPFYLYRYGGTCQKVHGMNVTEEFILFDTEDDYRNIDGFGTFHPDGKIDNVRIELCYYQRI